MASSLDPALSLLPICLHLGDTQATIVAQALSKIVALLYHSDHGVRGGASKVLTQLARHGKFP